MKQTMAQLFGPDEPTAWFSLLWGGRRESPSEVAGRVWATASAVQAALPEPGFDWMTPRDESYGLDAAPRSLEGLQMLAETRSKTSGPTTFHLDLVDTAQEEEISSISVNAGAETTYLGNTTVVDFQPSYPLGSEHEAAALFRKVVKIWQPDSAIVSTVRTYHQIDGLADTYASYLTWLSHSAFGSVPHLETAETEIFGEGTLITVPTWNVDTVRDLHRELLNAGVPSHIDLPERPQKVPRFPAGCNP